MIAARKVFCEGRVPLLLLCFFWKIIPNFNCNCRGGVIIIEESYGKKDVLMFEGKINGRETKEIFSVEKGRSSL